MREEKRTHIIFKDSGRFDGIVEMMLKDAKFRKRKSECLFLLVLI